MNNIVTKKCIKCSKEKPEKEFYFRTDTGKRRNACQECNLKFHKNLYREDAEKHKAFAREYSKRYYPKVREKKRQYAVENKEKIRERMRVYQKEYYEKNKETIKQRNKQWETKNPEKRAAITGKRRSRIISAEGNFTAGEWKELCEKYGQVCLCCGKRERLTPDHVIPLARGGSNWITNIQPLCRSCNASKGTKTIDYRTGNAGTSR